MAGRREQKEEGPLPRNPYLRNGAGEYIHRLVWESAHGPIPKDCCIHHINGRKRDNRLSNLECVPKWAHTPTNHNPRGGRI